MKKSHKKERAVITLPPRRAALIVAASKDDQDLFRQALRRENSTSLMQTTKPASAIDWFDRVEPTMVIVVSDPHSKGNLDAAALMKSMRKRSRKARLVLASRTGTLKDKRRGWRLEVDGKPAKRRFDDEQVTKRLVNLFLS